MYNYNMNLKVVVTMLSQVEAFLIPIVVNEGRNYGVVVKIDDKSFSNDGRVDVFVYTQEEEDLNDFLAWLWLTYEISESVAAA